MKKKIAALAAAGTILLSAASVLAAKPVDVPKGPPTECTTIQSGELLASTGEPLSTGFDEFGYNYQAHQYIGYYGNYQRPPELVDYGYRLMMKWNDAWLSNKDCSGDLKLDRHFGFPSYIGSGAWLTNHQSGEYMSDWSLIGEWVIDFDFGSHWIHDMVITDDLFSGRGGYPAGGPYSHPWTVSGTVDGNTVNMVIIYDGSGYTVVMTGTIAEDGSMGGSCTTSIGQTCTWQTTSGSAINEECSFNYFVKIVAVPADAYKDGGFWYTSEGVEIGEVIWGSFAVIQEVETDSCLGLHGMQYNSPASPGFGFYKP